MSTCKLVYLPAELLNIISSQQKKILSSSDYLFEENLKSVRKELPIMP